MAVRLLSGKARKIVERWRRGSTEDRERSPLYSSLFPRRLRLTRRRRATLTSATLFLRRHRERGDGIGYIYIYI